MIANASFSIKNWNEKPFSEVEGGSKLTHAKVSLLYSGDITGEGVQEYLMVYDNDGAATFNGIERVTGSIGDRAGSFVLQHSGTFKDGNITQHTVVVEGSATGALEGLRGSTSLTAGHQQTFPFIFDYTFN